MFRTTSSSRGLRSIISFPQSFKQKRPLTGITPLDDARHVEEVARLFSSETISESSRKLAEELIEAGRSA
jgi:DNA repair ATPase RecN